MDYSKIAVCSLLATIFTLLVYCLIQDWRRRKREIFADRIKALIVRVKKESCMAWGCDISNRWLQIQRNHFFEKICSNLTDSEKYIGYCIISEKDWDERKKLDFPGEYSVENFLSSLLNGVLMYGHLMSTAIREFVHIEGFSAPYDVYLKRKGDKCSFLYFDHLNYCTWSEVVVKTREIDWALDKSQSERLETGLGSSLILVKFEGSSVRMEFCTPRGWLPASFSREDFIKAYNDDNS